MDSISKIAGLSPSPESFILRTVSSLHPHIQQDVGEVVQAPQRWWRLVQLWTALAMSYTHTHVREVIYNDIHVLVATPLLSTAVSHPTHPP